MRYCWIVLASLSALGRAAHAQSAPDTAFLLTTTDPARAPSPFVGNGRLSVIVPALGLGASRSFVAGLFEEAEGDVPRIASVAAWNALAFHDGAAWLGLDSTVPVNTSVRDYRQVLDLRTGTATTTYEWVNGTNRTGVEVETFVSRAASALASIHLSLTPHQAGPMRVRFGMAAWPEPRRLPLGRQERASPGWKPADIWYAGHTRIRERRAEREPDGGVVWLSATPDGRSTEIALAGAARWPDSLAQPMSIAQAAGDSARVELAFEAVAGRRYEFQYVAAVATPVAGTRPLDRARRESLAARAAGIDALRRANAAAWSRRWETDIVLEGDPALQKVVRSMLFYLLASADSGTAMGIPPMGLSSGGYYGHVFWDSDTWMFPPLLVTHPDVARSLVAFRKRTLPAAQRNARDNGFRGAMYPWEADERGVETTPRFAIQNAKSEIHVNGDVALAQWQYYLATGDSAWLAREGFPVIKGTADFWVSRATFDSAGGRYHIRNVVSVSEGLIGVSDDAYTNAVARKNLEIAAAASRRLGGRPDPRWSDVAARLHLPFDSASGYYRTYEGAPDSTLGDVTPLLAYPLGVPMTDAAKRSQLEQAVKQLFRRGPGAMMGSTLLSVDAAELGDTALVDSLLHRSYQPHLRGPFLMLSETPTNDAVNFVTGAGGFLQQVIFGYTGLRLGEKGLEEAFPPILPSHVTRLELRNLAVRGRRLDVVVDRNGRRVSPRDGR
jgi:trehalose/maltose hydrolase-like predicted phosphorylase